MHTQKNSDDVLPVKMEEFVTTVLNAAESTLDVCLMLLQLRKLLSASVRMLHSLDSYFNVEGATITFVSSCFTISLKLIQHDNTGNF